MPTNWRTQKPEEDLYDEQLLDRMERLSEKTAYIGSYQDGEMQLQATEAQVRYAPALNDYFCNLWGIAREALQLTIIEDLEAVPTAERKEIVKSWWEETNEKSLEYRKVRNFILHESAEEAKEEINRLRSLIALELKEIVNGLSAFKFSSGYEFWPFVEGNDQFVRLAPVSGAESVVSGSRSSENGLVPGEAQPVQRRPLRRFVELLAGLIFELASDRKMPTWDNVAKAIQVGQAEEAERDKTHLLPCEFQERIAVRSYAGNLYDFLIREDKWRKEEIRKAKDNSQELDFAVISSDLSLKPIDFIHRFQNHFSLALAMTGHGKKRPRKKKSGEQSEA